MQKVETQAYSIFIEDNVVHIVYNEKEISLVQAEQIIDIRRKITKDKPHRICVDSRKVSFASKEVQNVSKRADVIYMTIACAILVSSTLNRLLANNFLRIVKPKSPTRLFDSREKALEWLQHYPILDRI